jgi:type IV fimbrial biogenesis protein FimT
MNRGFTLIELMITIAIAAILMALAAPSFTRVIQDNRVTTQANDLLTSIAVARSEAIKRAQNVSITPTGNDYANGWCVHTGATCADGPIRRHEALNGVALAGAPAAALVFNAIGRKTTPAGVQTFQLDPPTCTSGDQRRRSLSVIDTGRASITVVGCP